LRETVRNDRQVDSAWHIALYQFIVTTLLPMFFKTSPNRTMPSKRMFLGWQCMII